MNIFQQYGIKEVADVTFYSINRVGDEEFYTPVLLLDTLKVSTLEKKQQNVDSFGGYGNQKITSWSFNKTITLKLEDALFSPASMSLLWGGRLSTQFSKYTSAIVKINIANKYGKLNYSTLAQPSPILTAEEWDVIYQACDLLGKSFFYLPPPDGTIPFTTSDYNKDVPYIEENRIALQKSYYQRKFSNIFNEYVSAAQSNQKWEHSIEQDNIAIPNCIVTQILNMINNLKDLGQFNNAIYDVDVIDRMESCVVKTKEGLTISTTEQKNNLLKYYLNDKSNSYVIYYDPKTMLPLLSNDEEGNIIGWDDSIDLDLINNIPVTDHPVADYDYDDIINILNKGEWIVSLVKLNTIMYETGYVSKLYFIKHLSTLMQKELLWGFDYDGLFRVIRADKENFNFSDSVSVIHSSNDTKEKITDKFEPGQTYPQKSNMFKLRIGTPYLKWSRTVKENSDKGILGKTLIVNSDTFSNIYKIVGETYIKDRNGKDQRYQFVINEARITPETNITLQAEGEPTVFSMTIDVFTPPNDIMMELRTYDVIDDSVNGGTKILPQKENVTTTQTITTLDAVSTIDNEEFY